MKLSLKPTDADVGHSHPWLPRCYQLRETSFIMLMNVGHGIQCTWVTEDGTQRKRKQIYILSVNKTLQVCKTGVQIIKPYRSILSSALNLQIKPF